MSNQGKAYLFALGTVGLWSTIATASKLTVGLIRPVELLLYSASVSTIVLFIVIVLQKKLPVLLSFGWRDWYISLLYGLINPFAYYLALFKAYELLPAQQAQIINYSWAITLTLLSIPILGQKVGKMQWVAILVSYSGVMVIATKGDLLGLHFEDPAGVGVALLSTILWALYWILNTKDKRDPIVGLFANFTCALPFILGYLGVTQGFRKIPLGGFAGSIYIGCFEMGVAFVMWLTAMKLTKSTARIANLIFIAPFLSLFMIHYLVGEQIYVSTIIGLFLVLAGLLLQTAVKGQDEA